VCSVQSVVKIFSDSVVEERKLYHREHRVRRRRIQVFHSILPSVVLLSGLRNNDPKSEDGFDFIAGQHEWRSGQFLRKGQVIRGAFMGLFREFVEKLLTYRSFERYIRF